MMEGLQPPLYLPQSWGRKEPLPMYPGTVCAFICGFVCACIYGFVCAFICGFVCACIYGFVCAFICGLIRTRALASLPPQDWGGFGWG